MNTLKCTWRWEAVFDVLPLRDAESWVQTYNHCVFCSIGVECAWHWVARIIFSPRKHICGSMVFCSFLKACLFGVFTFKYIDFVSLVSSQFYTYTSFELTLTEIDGAWNTSVHLNRHSGLKYCRWCKANRLSGFVSSACLGDVVTVVSRRPFICCVSHDIFIRVGLQRVGGDQVLSGL